jgi:hypothetical protein
MPTFGDLKKWNNRVVTNLLYFQTNYFILFLILFLLASSFQSQEVVQGVTAVSIALAVAFLAMTQHDQIKPVNNLY